MLALPLTFLLGVGRLEVFIQVRSEGISEFHLRELDCTMPHRILIISNLWVLGGPARALGWWPLHQHTRLMAKQAH